MITVLALALAAGSAGEIETEGEILASLLSGAWSNTAQYEAADESLKRPPAPGHPYDWLDLQHARFVPVETPHIPGDAVYLEWRSGGPDGPVSRQRLWVFHSEIREHDSPLTGMDFYAFRNPEAFEGRAGGSDFTGLTVDDLIDYPEDCRLAPVFREGGVTVLEVDESACVITAQSGRQMGINARIELSLMQVRYSESGRLDGGAFAFKVPGAGAYEFDRLLD